MLRTSATKRFLRCRRSPKNRSQTATLYLMLVERLKILLTSRSSSNRHKISFLFKSQNKHRTSSLAKSVRATKKVAMNF